MPARNDVTDYFEVDVSNLDFSTIDMIGIKIWGNTNVAPLCTVESICFL
ncbi:MAG: hypothetical protein HFJ60_03370 [Clostridia bacterium]|nr:hypothetical protein [Clostridia bacterium]